MTFDLDLWPTDLNINRGHVLIKDYLPTKFEASGAKRSWVISCTKWSRLAWPSTLTFDLLTWISIGIIYSSRTIYLPSLKLLGKAFLGYQLNKVKGYRHTDRHTDRQQRLWLLNYILARLHFSAEELLLYPRRQRPRPRQRQRPRRCPHAKC